MAILLLLWNRSSRGFGVKKIVKILVEICFRRGLVLRSTVLLVLNQYNENCGVYKNPFSNFQENKPTQAFFVEVDKLLL